MMVSNLVMVLLLTLILWVLLYLYFTRNFQYWKKANIPFIKPRPFFGNAFDVFILKKSIGDLLRELYESSAVPVLGFFFCNEPCLLIRDPKMIKNVLVKDFDNFCDRTLTNNKKDDPMGSHILFLLKINDGWRDFRKKLTPVFSTGKMRLMYKLINDVGSELVSFTKSKIEQNPVIDVRELTQKYTTDTITSTAFGVNANCFKIENTEFRQVSRRILNWDILERGISTTCHFIAPGLVKLFKMKFIDKASATFLRDIFWKMMEEREQSKFVRGDLLDILIEMRKTQKINVPSNLEGDKLVAQATQFFIAGYETTSTTLTFTMYELAKSPEIQQKLREEVITVINKNNDITYDSLQEMTYMDLCIKETLRKYPSVPFLDRRAKNNYKFPGTDITIDKGTAVFIPTWALHMDPRYFPDPEKYDPLRFTTKKIEELEPFCYLPFGDGPRNCIGARFGLLSAKSCLAHLLSQFEIELCAKTNEPVKLNPRGFMLAPIRELNLRLKKYEAHTKC